MNEADLQKCRDIKEKHAILSSALVQRHCQCSFHHAKALIATIHHERHVARWQEMKADVLTVKE